MVELQRPAELTYKSGDVGYDRAAMIARLNRLLLIAAIVLLAAALRECAVTRLPFDFDEPVYGEAAIRYADHIRSGDLAGLVNESYAAEHPGLVKLLYAGVLLTYPPLPPSPPAGEPVPQIYIDSALSVRRSSAFFGVIHVLLLALVSPPAGALLAIHTYTVKYTAQIYLEALPMFTATVAVLAYIRAQKEANARAQRRKGASDLEGELEVTGGIDPSSPVAKQSSRVFASLRLGVNSSAPWWALSAVALGLTAAGKYVYAVAGLAIVADYLWRWLGQRRGAQQVAGGRWQVARQTAISPAPPLPSSPAFLPLLAWGVLALIVFYAANPYLWPNPIGRLFESLTFHAAYSQSQHVQQSGYPWYQPFVWLFTPQPVRWHPFAIVTPLDTLTAVSGLLGLRRMWGAYGGNGRVIVLWWGIGLLFLLLWSTKWPQYSLIMTAPMCLCAAEGLRWLWSLRPDSAAVEI
jgi:hypothetical protein